jgi:cyclophilin family peptidyl-prolyl cis-trans isomerase
MKKVFDSHSQFPNPAIFYVIGLFDSARLEFIQSTSSAKNSKEVQFEVKCYFESELKILMENLKKRHSGTVIVNDPLPKEDAFVVKNGVVVPLSEFYDAVGISEDGVSEAAWNDFSQKAQKRKELEVYEKGRSFVEMSMVAGNDESFKILIELFEKDFPKFTKRFVDNCSRLPRSASYCGTMSKFVQKGLYMQFGEIENEESIPFLEDELHLYQHHMPGLLGYVKVDQKKHTNRCQFYITFNPISHFDYKTIVFGRVVEGLETLESLQEQLIRIQNAIEIKHRQPEAERIKQETLKAQKEELSSSLVFSKNKDITKAIASINKSNTYGGPKRIEFKNFKEKIDTEKLQQIKLYKVETITIDHSDLSDEFYTEAFMIAKFFPKVVSLVLKNITMEASTLTKILANGQMQALKFVNFHISHARHLKFLQDIHRITNNFKGINTLVFKECLLNPEAFAFIGPDERLFDACLKCLTISNCTLLDEGLKLVIAKINSCQLEKLSVHDCKLTSESLELLNSSKIFSSLKSLNISQNYEVVQFIQSLSENSKIKHLKKLTAKNCYLTPECVHGIINGKNLVFLQTLSLDQNCFIFDALIDSFNDKVIPSNLRKLSLRSCRISNESMDRFVKVRNMPNFDLVDLSRNDDINWQAHASHQWFDQTEFWGRIKTLKIDNKSVTSELADTLKNDYGVPLD